MFCRDAFVLLLLPLALSLVRRRSFLQPFRRRRPAAPGPSFPLSLLSLLFCNGTPSYVRVFENEVKVVYAALYHIGAAIFLFRM
ncbi:hypothetical protein BX666DRAFT_1886083 [Dichotomocladium elegans]|nr:hypothetical protein BX666DRAFT_1886083 [Dichotomocladium elegans]